MLGASFIFVMPIMREGCLAIEHTRTCRTQVTCDVSTTSLEETLPVLHAERPGATGYDRVCSVETWRQKAASHFSCKRFAKGQAISVWTWFQSGSEAIYVIYAILDYSDLFCVPRHSKTGSDQPPWNILEP